MSGDARPVIAHQGSLQSQAAKKVTLNAGHTCTAALLPQISDLFFLRSNSSTSRKVHIVPTHTLSCTITAYIHCTLDAR